MTARILLVDDDENILHAYTRNLRKQFDIDTASSGAAALGLLAALKAVLETEAIAQAGQARGLLVSELRAGQVLVHAVETLDGWMVAPEGTVLGAHHLELIRNFHRVNRVREPVKVIG